MIGTRIQVRDNLGHITAKVEALAAAAIDEATVAAAAATQQSSTIDLQLKILSARRVPEGIAGGVTSRKRGSSSDVRLAPIFDGGSLGKRRRKLATSRARRESWEVSRRGTTFTAHRHELTGEMGIEPQNFFAKGRRAGRAAMIEKLRRGL